MTAAVYSRFGGPDVVSIARRPTPRPRSGEVLVKVHAATVSAADHRARAKDIPRGLRTLSSFTLGFSTPRRPVLGMDIAGVVVAVGAEVTRYRPGDAVIAMLGARFGGHAEYAIVPEGAAIARKPEGLGFEDAAALVFGGVTAQAFLARAGLSSGAAVLVNGASGAVGTAAVQLAQSAGAIVTAVTSGANADLVRSLGAQRMIDHTRTDFVNDDATYDVIVDCVGNVPFAHLEPLIRPGGALLSVITDLRGMLSAGLRARRSGKRVIAGNVPYRSVDLAHVARLAEEGRFRPVVERVLDLADIAEAHRRVDTGRKRGNVVVRIAGSDTAERA
ncbi:MAG: NAD(P)-dependent alcohol dehydrogenase [Microbacterium sp.]|nr:MAG: NAD(P)-dependent alcohol dehydrogenase [Microbacterium sp.]